MALIMCIYLDYFYTRAVEQIHPDLHRKPFVIMEPGSRGKIVEISPQARAVGLDSGLSRTQIQQLYPGTRIIDFRPDDYEPFAETDWEFYYSLTPAVEPVELHCAFLDISKSADPGGIIHAILSREKTSGRIPFIGVAKNKLLARIISRYLYHEQQNGNVKTITDKEEHTFLSRVSIKHIPFLPEKNYMDLIRLGIKTIGDLIQIPFSQLSRQLGDPVLARKLLDITDDRNNTTVTPAYPPDRICKTADFNEGITNYLHAETALKQMCHDIAQELKISHRCCQNLRLTATSTGISRTASQYLQEPSADPGTLTLVSLALIRRIPLQEAVHSLRLEALDLQPASYRQAQLFVENSHPRPNSECLQKAITAVQKRCGRRAIRFASEIQLPRRDLMLLTLRKQHLC